MIWHDPDKFFFDNSDVPDTDVGKLVTNQNRLLEKQSEMISPYNLNYDPENGLTTNRKLTNADRIRAMSDEELAEKFRWLVCPFYWVSLPDETDRPADWSCKQNCRKCWLDWLKTEVDDGD